jgi:formimidoylglutamate deiminase
VWRRGDKLVSAGRHRDRDAITSRYRQALETLIR